jgi:hypothetical protein
MCPHGVKTTGLIAKIYIDHETTHWGEGLKIEKKKKKIFFFFLGFGS